MTTPLYFTVNAAPGGPSWQAPVPGVLTPTDAFASGYCRLWQYDTSSLVAFGGPTWDTNLWYFTPDSRSGLANGSLSAPRDGAYVVTASVAAMVAAAAVKAAADASRATWDAAQAGAASGSGSATTPMIIEPDPSPVGSTLVAWDHLDGIQFFATPGTKPSGVTLGSAGVTSAAVDVTVLHSLGAALGGTANPAGMSVFQVDPDSTVFETWVAPGWGVSSTGARGPEDVATGKTVVTAPTSTVPLDEATALSTAYNWKLVEWDHGADADPTAPVGSGSAARGGMTGTKTYADPNDPTNVVQFLVAPDNNTGFFPKVWRADGTGNVPAGPMAQMSAESKYIPTSSMDADNHHWLLHNTNQHDGTQTWFPPAGFVDPNIFLTFPLIGWLPFPASDDAAASIGSKWKRVAWDHDSGERTYVPATAQPGDMNRLATYYIPSDTDLVLGVTHVWVDPAWQFTAWGASTGGATNAPMANRGLPTITSPLPGDPQSAYDALLVHGWIDAGRDNSKPLAYDESGNLIPPNELFWSPDGRLVSEPPGSIVNVNIPASWKDAENTGWVLVEWVHDPAASESGKVATKTYVPHGTKAMDTSHAVVFPVTPDFGSGPPPWVQVWHAEGWGPTITVTTDPTTGVTVWGEDSMTVEGLTLVDLDVGNKHALYVFGPDQQGGLERLAGNIADPGVGHAFAGAVGVFIDSRWDGLPYIQQARHLAALIQADAVTNWPLACAVYANIAQDGKDTRSDKLNAVGGVLHGFKLVLEKLGGDAKVLDQLESQMISAASHAYLRGGDAEANAAATAVLHGFLQGVMPWVNHSPGTNEPTHEAEVTGLHWKAGLVSADGKSAMFTAPGGGQLRLTLTTPVDPTGPGGGTSTGPGGGTSTGPGGGTATGPGSHLSVAAPLDITAILAAAGAGFLIGGPPGAAVGAAAGWYLGKPKTTTKKTAGYTGLRRP